MGQEGISHSGAQFLWRTGNESETAENLIGFGDIFGRRAEEGRRGNHILDFVLEDQLVSPGSDAVHITLKIVDHELNIVLLVPNFDTTASVDDIGG